MHGRERIAELLDAVVGRARGMLEGGRLPPDEAPNVMMFYVLADHLRSATRDAAQPMHLASLAGGLRQLKARCSGTLADQQAQVEAALEETDNVDWEYRTA